MTTAPEPPSDRTTLVAVIDGYEADGYTSEFGAAEDGLVRCFSCREDTPAGQVTVVSLRRIEGASDPDDMAAVVAVVCPKCDARGTLVLKYGPDASVEETEVLAALDAAPRLTEDRASGGVGHGGGGFADQ